MKSISQRLGMLLAAFLLVIPLAVLPGCSSSDTGSASQTTQATQSTEAQSEQVESGDASGQDSSEQADADFVFDLSQVPDYTGSPYTIINDNVPVFDEDDLNGPAESYSDLDSLGRCGEAIAIVSEDTMPNEERGSIGMIKPAGWHTVRYDDVIDGKYLYNRCHLIGYQLTGENANEKNLITGTRYMNVDGMLPFENEVADYVEETGNSVLYRSTPIYVDDELVARGVHLEAWSIEDEGEGVSFNVYCYNVQPDVEIDYATGNSQLADESEAAAASDNADEEEQEYVLNTSSKKFHLPTCSSVDEMSDHNKKEIIATRSELIDQGYDPCGNCNP